MRIKGYAIVPRKQAEPMQVDEEHVGVAMDADTAKAMGFPDHNDIIMCFRTEDPEWYELVCITEVHPRCREMMHMVHHHMDEIEELLNKFKKEN